MEKIVIEIRQTIPLERVGKHYTARLNGQDAIITERLLQEKLASGQWQLMNAKKNLHERIEELKKYYDISSK